MTDLEYHKICKIFEKSQENTVNPFENYHHEDDIEDEDCLQPLGEIYLRKELADKLYAKKDGGTITLPDGSNIDLSEYLKKEAAEQIYLKKTDTPKFDKTGLATEDYVRITVNNTITDQDAKNTDFNKRINVNQSNIDVEKKMNETQNTRLDNIDTSLKTKVENTAFETFKDENSEAHTTLEESITNKAVELNTKIDEHIKVYEAAIGLKADKTE